MWKHITWQNAADGTRSLREDEDANMEQLSLRKDSVARDAMEELCERRPERGDIEELGPSHSVSYLQQRLGSPKESKERAAEPKPDKSPGRFIPVKTISLLTSFTPRYLSKRNRCVQRLAPECL